MASDKVSGVETVEVRTEYDELMDRVYDSKASSLYNQIKSRVRINERIDINKYQRNIEENFGSLDKVWPRVVEMMHNDTTITENEGTYETKSGRKGSTVYWQTI